MIPRLAGRFRTLFFWMVTGAVLDAAAVVGVWTVLNGAGPMNPILEEWLCVVGIMFVPWYVHVVGLPVVFDAAPIPAAMSRALLIRGLVFVVIAALLIPFLGATTGLFFGLLLTVSLRAGAFLLPAAPHILTDRLAEEACVVLTAVITGAAVGALLHIVRAGDLISFPDPPHKPGVRSDVLGGATAAFLGFGSVYVGLPLGVFDLPATVPSGWMHNVVGPPQLSPSVLIVVVAMLPHLFMVGEDFFGRGLRSA